MSTMENQVAQIFERTKRIIDQARQQCHLWEHHLYPKLILTGIPPPPWLHSHPKELNKDDLVSEVLLSQPQFRAPFSGRHCNLYSNLGVLSDDVQYPTGLHTEVHALKKDSNVRDCLSNLPDCSVNDDGCASSGPPELGSAMSPQNQVEPRVSDSYHDPALSLAKLQRSKSRQRALELRNSAKAPKTWSESDNNAGISAGTVTGCVSSVLHADHIEESDLVKYFHSNIQSCSLEEVRGVDCMTHTYDKSNNSGRITRSKSLAQKSNSLNVVSSSVVKEDGPPSYNSNEPLDLVSRPCFTNGSCEVKEACKEECQRKEARSRAYRKRLTKSRSSKQADYSSEILKLDNTSGTTGRGKAVEVHDFLQQFACVGLTDLSIAPDHNNGSGRNKVKDGDVYNNKGESDIHGSRIRLLRNSCTSPGDEFLMTDVSVKSINKSVQSPQPLISKHSQDPAVSVVGSLCSQKDPNFCAVKAKECLSIGDSGKSQNHIEEISKFLSSNFHEERATCSESAGTKSPNVRLAEPDARRLSSSEKDPILDAELAMNSAEKENIETVVASRDTRIEKLLAAHENILSGVNPTGNIEDRSAATVAKVNADVGCLIENDPPCLGPRLPSVSPKVGLDVSVLRLPSDFVRSVMPTQLDFNDVEESSMNASSSSDMKEGQQGMSPEEEPLNLLEPVISLDEESCLVCQGQCNSPEETHMLETQDALILKEGPQIEDCPSHFEEADVARKAINALSPNEELPVVQKELCTLSSSLKNHLSLSLVAGENSSGSLSKEVMASKFVSVNGKLENDESSAKLDDAFSTAVTGNDLHKYADETVTNFSVGFSVTAHIDEVNVGLTHQASDSISLCQYGDLLRKKWLSDGKNTGLSTDFQIFDSSIESFTYDVKHSYPQHKKRKIETETEKFLPVSSKLFEKPLDSIEQKYVSRNLSIEEDNPEAVLEVQRLTSDQEDDIGHRYVSDSTVEETQGTGECRPMEVSSLKVRNEEEKLIIDGSDRSADSLLFAEANPTGFGVDSTMSCTMDEKVESWHHQVICGQEIAEDLTCVERSNSNRRSYPGGNAKFSDGPSVSPGIQCLDSIGADDTVPEFEGFFMQSLTDNTQPCTAGDQMELDKMNLPVNSIDCKSLSKSRFMHSPLCYSSTPYKLHNIPDLCQSLPNGILEGMSLRTSLTLNDGSARSLSDCLPNCKGSSVQTLWDRINSKFGSSGKRQSLKLELPCISEENENVDEIADRIQKGIGSEGMTCSITREPLAEIIDDANPSTSALQDVSTDGRADVGSTEFNFSGTDNNVKKKLDVKQDSNRRRFTSRGKENQSTSLGANGAKRTTESVGYRSSRPKLSGKDSMKQQGRISNNIVSNITSFIPLVQQKQAAAVITGKRDIKVKALETAEAAKRMAEKKENERKMKKEALRLERERLEQQNLRQLELQKKKKEEERKKKEAEMAAKKRQREDEEKKEKERKRKRVNDSKKQQQEHGKIHAKKEEIIQCRAAGEEVQESKKFMDERENHKNLQLQDFGKGNEEKISVAEPLTTRDLTNDKTLESCLEYSEAVNDCANNGKGMGSLIKANEDDDLNIQNSLHEQSYEISPYKGSDDEDEDEDDVPNNKFIPSWASKHRLSLVVSSQKIDPETVFPPQSFCNIAEVLLPRKIQL